MGKEKIEEEKNNKEAYKIPTKNGVIIFVYIDTRICNKMD